MHIVFAIIAAFTLVSAVAAMSLRNLVHCALCLALAFAGLAAFYLQLGAAFVGWSQVLVYIGAVAILIVFAILLTRSGDGLQQAIVSRSWMVGLGIAVLVFGWLAKAVMSSSVAGNPLLQTMPSKPEPTVREIGNQLMTRYVLPLEVIGLLLTAAAIGAVIIAMKDSGRGQLAGPGTKPEKTAQPETLRPLHSESHGQRQSEEIHS